MSDNATGRFTATDQGICVSVSGKSAMPYTPIGNVSGTPKAIAGGNEWGSGRWIGYIDNVTSNVAHTHTLPSSYIYGKTDDESQNHTHSVTASGTISGDAETRPINYTIRVWKRVS